MSGEKITQVKTLRLNKGVINKVEERAKKENRSFANMVETILINSTQQTNAF